MEQKKTRYDLDRQTAIFLALSSGNVCKYEFWTGNDVLPEEDLLEIAAKMKIFEYFSLGKELKAQTDIGQKQYDKLVNNFKLDKIIKRKTIT